MFHTSVNCCQANGARRSESVWKTPKRFLFFENPRKIEGDVEDEPVRRVQ